MELWDLIKFVGDDGGKIAVYTNLTDDTLLIKEGECLDPAYTFEDYKLKVNRLGILKVVYGKY